MLSNLTARTIHLLEEEPTPLDKIIEIGLNRIAAQRKYYLANHERIKRNLKAWRADQKRKS